MKKYIITLIVITLTGCASANKPTEPDTKTLSQASGSTSIVAHPIAAEPSDSVKPDFTKLSCMKKKENRSLVVVKKGNGCALDYQKDGKTEAVAHSFHGLKHCLHSEKKIRAKLEHAGFKCT